MEFYKVSSCGIGYSKPNKNNRRYAMNMFANRELKLTDAIISGICLLIIILTNTLLFDNYTLHAKIINAIVMIGFVIQLKIRCSYDHYSKIDGYMNDKENEEWLKNNC